MLRVATGWNKALIKDRPRLFPFFPDNAQCTIEPCFHLGNIYEKDEVQKNFKEKQLHNYCFIMQWNNHKNRNSF